MRAEIERLILGAILSAKDPQRLFDASGLTPDDFSDNALRSVFDLARRRSERHLEVNAITVWSTGRAARRLQEDDLGWLSALEAGNSLDDRAFLKLAEDLRSEVRGRQLAARLRDLAAEVERPGYHPAKISAQLEGHAQTIARTYQANRTAENDPVEVLDDWQRSVTEGRTLYTSTGIKIFDEQFGGYVPNLNLLAGPPSIGKSGLLASGIVSQLEAGMRVGLFGLEDGHRWISRRLYAWKLGLPVRAIGNAKLDDAGWLRAAEVGAQLSPLLKNLLVYKWGGANADEICRWGLSWIINEGVRCIYVDNATELDHSASGRGDRGLDFRIQVARSVSRLRDFAERYQIPLVVLAHTTREYEEHRHKRPPFPSEVAEGAAFERKTRLFLGCWAKQWSPELRVTLGKANEAAPDLTFAFERRKEAALVDLESGRLVDLKSEEQKEKREQKDRKLDQSVAESLERAARLAKAKAAAPPVTPAAPTEEKKPEPPPQLDLLAETKP